MSSRVSGALAAGAAGLVLASCATSTEDQKAWADALEGLDGIKSVSVEHVDGGVGADDQYKAEIINAPGITEKQARAVAAESCEHDTRISDVRISTSDSIAPSVEKAHLADQACIDADSIVRYSRVSTAINDMPEKFDGSITVLGLQDERDATDGQSFLVEVGATDNASILNALAALHQRIQHVPLTVEAAVSEHGTTLAREGEPINATLSPDAELDALVPLVKAALKLDRRAITMTDDSLTVNLTNSKKLDSPKVKQLRRKATRAGVALNIGIPPFAGNADHGLLKQVLSVPGGATVKAPDDGETAVYPNTIAGLKPAAELLATSDLDAKFRMYSPKAPDTFWVDVEPGDISEKQINDAFTAIKPVRSQLADAQWVHRLIVSFGSDKMTLSVYLDDSADADNQDVARKTLTPLPRGVFDTVRLYKDGESERIVVKGERLRK